MGYDGIVRLSNIGKKTKLQGDNMKKARYEVRGVKVFTGREGYGYNATIYKDGKKVADAFDDASGGPSQINFSDEKEENLFYRYMKRIQKSADLYVEDLVNKAAYMKNLYKLSVKKTVFNLKSDKDGVWRTVNAPFSKEVYDFLKKQYGEDLGEIL